MTLYSTSSLFLNDKKVIHLTMPSNKLNLNGGVQKDNWLPCNDLIQPLYSNNSTAVVLKSVWFWHEYEVTNMNCYILYCWIRVTIVVTRSQITWVELLSAPRLELLIESFCLILNRRPFSTIYISIRTLFTSEFSFYFLHFWILDE